MSIELGCRLILARNANVAAMVNDTPANTGLARIYFGLAGQDQLKPRIVLALTNSQHEHTFEGHAGYVTGTIQAAFLAADYPTARALADAAIAALDGYEGTVESVTGLDVAYITVDSENDIPVVVPPGAPAPATQGIQVNFNFMTLK